MLILDAFRDLNKVKLQNEVCCPAQYLKQISTVSDQMESLQIITEIVSKIKAVLVFQSLSMTIPDDRQALL